MSKKTKVDCFSKRVKAKLKVRDENESVALPKKFFTSINQLKNAIGYAPKFYEALYKADLRLQSIAQNPKFKSLN